MTRRNLLYCIAAISSFALVVENGGSLLADDLTSGIKYQADDGRSPVLYAAGH